MDVVRKWHEARTDLEMKIAKVMKDGTEVLKGQRGDYKRDVFMGHCEEDDQSGYLPIVAPKEVMARVAQEVWD